MKKNENMKFILWQLNRAYHYDQILEEIPEQKYYVQGSKYFTVIEMRNEAINSAVKEANTIYGTDIKMVRIHQRDIRNAKLMLSSLIRVRCAAVAV